MLVTQQPVLRRFWYPIVPIAQLSTEHPYPFELLGQKIVLWLNSSKQSVAIANKCCHRSAQLSKGAIANGCIRCPYHGWAYNGEGKCVDVPQFKSQPIPTSYQVAAFQCVERYDYAWVCLGDPLQPIPAIPEADILTFG